MRNKLKVIGIMAMLIVFMFLFNSCKSTSNDALEETEQEYHRAKVIKAIDEEQAETEHSGGSIKSNIQKLEVLIINGEYKGQKFVAEYQLNFDFSGKYKSSLLSEGDDVLVFLEEAQEEEEEEEFKKEDNKEDTYIKASKKVYVAEIIRDKYLLYLAIGFIFLLLVVGGLKGLKAIVSLILTGVAIIYILLPAILKGWDPVIVSVFICVCVIGLSLVIISGFNRKTLSAILGTAGGILGAGIIALIIGSLAKLTGFGDEESRMLMYIPQNIQFDFRGLLFAGIIIGTMGATMDVGMSIASAMHEIKHNSPDIKTSSLIRAGMNVGRDTMATMANTLILAYTGGSLHLMLLLMAYKTPFTHIINWDTIASEVLRAVAGSIGIVLAVPITVLASALIDE